MTESTMARAALLAGMLALAGSAGAAAQQSAGAPQPAMTQQDMATQQLPAVPASTRAAVDRLIDAALKDSSAYRKLGELVDFSGPRLSGSEALERAIDWTMARMKADGLENVHAEPVMVPHWVRGEESAELVQPRPARLHMLGLGMSVATPPGGITAPVLVVSSRQELAARAAEARGRIVLFDAPFVSYGETVQYRANAAIWAAQAGAVAALIRSIAPFSMQSPHTGSLRYDSATARIPAAALSLEDASLLHRMQERGQTPVVHLLMSAQTLPPAPSRNVVAEMRGAEKPDEVVLVSGHLDSWDVGQGAMDDAGGVVAAWEAVRLMKQLGLRPKRTVRVVAWVNEENGIMGGRAYAQAHAAELGQHVLAIESDEGVFKPRGFSYTGPPQALAAVRAVAALLKRIDAAEVGMGGGGADISPIMRQGVPGMGLDVDGTKYFWYHHSEGDTLDKLDAREVALCVAAIAGMAYGVADLEAAMPHDAVTR